MASSQCDESFALGEHESAGANKQRTGPALDERCKRCLDVAASARIKNDELLSDRLCRCLQVPSFCLGLSCVWMDEYGDRCRLGHEVAQQLQSLLP
jgi:hypothetical protein